MRGDRIRGDPAPRHAVTPSTWSCPPASARRRISATRSLVLLWSDGLRAGDRFRDRVEHCLDLVARCGHGEHRAQGDERHEQRVLQQVLPFVIANQRPNHRLCVHHEASHRVLPWKSVAAATHRSFDPGSCYTPGIALAIALNTACTLVPAAVTASTAPSAMSATSNAYSSRSWPSSLR